VSAAPVWLEVALNGTWGTTRQPWAPVTTAALVAEAVACIDAGASIVHLHAFDDAGQPREAYELYAPVLEAIRAARDAVCYPTVPMGPVPASDAEAGRARYAVVDRLGAAGLAEWAVVDPGSLVVATTDELSAGGDGFLYANGAADVRAGLEVCARHRLVPSFAVYEPGFTRLGAALRNPAAPRPVHRFMFSDTVAFGFPPTPWALEAHLQLLALCDPGAPWMVAGLGVELGELTEVAIDRGGHVRVGLEDAPLGCDRTNVELVHAARRRIEDAGRRVAAPAEVRAATLGA
jgi:uncharacterized protein (DUF849 family)